MKTTANFRKAAVRTAAVVVSFILISFTVSAQEFWKKLLTNSSFNEIAIAMVETGNSEKTLDDSKTLDAEWKQFDMAFDPALELEGWMTSEEHFGVRTLYYQDEMDAPLYGETGLLYLDYSADTSEPLVIEDWMVQSEVWMN